MSRRALLAERDRRTPAGHWPISALYSWVAVAGRSLVCTRCSAESRAPLPTDVAAYNSALETWLAQHRRCA